MQINDIPQKFFAVTTNCIKNICIGFVSVHNLSYQNKEVRYGQKKNSFGEGFDNRVCVHVLWYNFSNMNPCPRIVVQFYGIKQRVCPRYLL